MKLFYLLLCCITFRTHLAFTKYQNFKTRFMLKVIKVYALKMLFLQYKQTQAIDHKCTKMIENRTFTFNMLAAIVICQ